MVSKVVWAQGVDYSIHHNINVRTGARSGVESILHILQHMVCLLYNGHTHHLTGLSMDRDKRTMALPVTYIAS